MRALVYSNDLDHPIKLLLESKNLTLALRVPTGTLPLKVPFAEVAETADVVSALVDPIQTSALVESPVSRPVPASVRSFPVSEAPVTAGDVELVSKSHAPEQVRVSEDFPA